MISGDLMSHALDHLVTQFLHQKIASKDSPDITVPKFVCQSKMSRSSAMSLVLCIGGRVLDCLLAS